MVNRLAQIITAAALFSATGLLLGVHPDKRSQTSSSATPLSGQDTNSNGKAENPAKRELAYHREPPTTPLPETLDPSQFVNSRAAFVAYSLAAKIRELLYQEPCYCGCTRRNHHHSLLDCFTSKHGFRCPACQQETMFIYTQSKSGKTPAEIRKAMENGEVWKFNVDRYVDAYYHEHSQPLP